MTKGGNGNGHRDRAREFLRTAHLYRLGQLPTERPHARTRRLSEWAASDLPRAVAVLKDVDHAALAACERYAEGVDRLGRAVQATLDAGRTVFLCGCGATGRLSLTLESLWRGRAGAGERVQAFMAGGDVALVHSLEGFEDYPAHGARHLEQMGFAPGDLLIACTEGGETPYVIGATERAAQLSTNRPFFLYCNADAVLSRHVERFRRVRDNPAVEKLCLAVGPMALAGSTRMQASTVLQLAVGLALFDRGRGARERIASYRGALRETDLGFLAPLVEREAAIYRRGDRVSYAVRDFGITVLTDTTERAPTFSLVPFDQLVARLPRHSLCYVALCEADSADDAWRRLLNREPRALDWPEVDARTTDAYLRRFDFSVHALDKRRRQLPDRTHHELGIRGTADGIAFELGELAHEVLARGLPELFRHLLLKQILNIHSTLVMGRLGRYEGNLMTWVTPTNGKLVDRAARYVGHLLDGAGLAGPGYDGIVHRLFEELEGLPPGEPIVLRTFEALRRAAVGGRPDLPRAARVRARRNLGDHP